MAENTPEDAAAAPAPKKSSKLVLIISLLAVIMTVQVIITFVALKLLIPAAPAADAAEKSAAGGKAEKSNQEKDEAIDTNAEVPLGDFNCTNVIAEQDATLYVDLKITVMCTSDYKKTLEDKLKEHAARIREIVSEIVRSSKREDLEDPKLITIKRKVREDINRLLRQTYIEQVLVTDFRSMPQ